MDWLRDTVVLLLLGTAAALLQPALAALLRALFPMDDSAAVRWQEEELRQRYGAALSDIDTWLTLLSMVGLVATPVLVYWCVRWLAAAVSAAGGEHVLFYGFWPIAVPIMIGGAILPVALGPALIRIKHSGEARAALSWLFWLGDREEGGLNRLIVRNAKRFSLALILVPLAFSGDRYTVVGSKGIDLRRGAWSRELIPRSRVVAGGIAVQTKRADEACLLLDDGRVLDDRDDGDGRLRAGRADTATPAVQFLHDRWGLPVKATTDEARRACDLAREAARARGR
jgi:hypothetical protein